MKLGGIGRIGRNWIDWGKIKMVGGKGNYWGARGNQRENGGKTAGEG